MVDSKLPIGDPGVDVIVGTDGHRNDPDEKTQGRVRQVRVHVLGHSHERLRSISSFLGAVRDLAAAAWMGA